jgi:2-succinyl-5-enolpyruvyl-6-hydroxy-3-cyclohexene-1-carboxylate synthase
MARNHRQVERVPGRRPRLVNESSDIAAANLRCAAALIGALVRLGVQHFVISSGSRCAPLVLAVSHRHDIHVWPHPDERAAGFRALGIGKALHRPAVLICTSGTAAANYYPAVVEARMSHTPMIVLTADRPPHLRGKGAPQTIDQVDLYARYPLCFADLPAPMTGEDQSETWRDHAARAHSQAIGLPAGPVHLNVPFDEPLIPEPPIAEQIFRDCTAEYEPLASLRTVSSLDISPEQHWETARNQIRQARRPLIVYGPQNDCDDPNAVLTRSAARSRMPILADIASQMRTGGRELDNIVSHYDLYLRDPDFARRAVPDLVIRFGGLPTSKVLNDWLAGCRPAAHIAVAPGGQIADPYDPTTQLLVGDLPTAADRLFHPAGDAPGDPAYASLWQAADTAAANVIAAHQQEHTTRDVFEGDIVAAVFRDTPANSIVYLSNSMPIRWADTYVPARPSRLRVLVNRGANGIDGMIASAAGAASAAGRKVTLVIGDLAFLHDLNGLWGLAKDQLPLKIILIDNDGGGIFSFLPIVRHERVLDPLVAMPHGLDFAAAAAFYGIPCQRAASLAEFRGCYAEALQQPGPQIVAVHTNRQRTAALHRELCRRVCAHLPNEV